MIANLITSHEEADTKIVMHALDAPAHGFERVVVNTRDTDILIRLIHHDIPIEVWMNSSTSKEKRYTHVHQEREVHKILGFHALTGSDSTSQFYGHGKKTYTKFQLSSNPAVSMWCNIANDLKEITKTATIKCRFLLKMELIIV